MSNDFFESAEYEVTSGATARSTDINAFLQALESAFDKFFSEAQIHAGLEHVGTDSGTADAYVVAMPKTKSAYTDGMLVVFKPLYGNTTTTPSVNVDSLGAKTITRGDGTAVVAGEIAAGKWFVGRYNATSGNMEMQGALYSIYQVSADTAIAVTLNDANTTDVYLKDKMPAANPASTMITRTQDSSPVALTAAQLAGVEMVENNDGGAETLSVAYGLKTCTNTGATGEVNFTLPAAAAGLETAFLVTAAQTLKVTPNGTDYFRYGATSAGAGKYMSSATAGRWWHIKCHAAGIWDVVALNGSITYED